MIRKLALAFALALSLVSVGACAPAPSKSGEKAATEAKPEDLCKHVREVADKDSDDAAVLDQVERECVETLTGLQTRYQTLTTCVELAADANAIYECEKGLAKPRSLLASVGPMAKVEALCDHVLSLIQQLGAAAPAMSPDEMETLRTQCVQDASKQLEVQGPEAFNKDADCILAAKTIEELTACGI